MMNFFLNKKNILCKFRSSIILIGLIIFSYINIQLYYIRFSVADDYLLNNIISGTFGNSYDSQLLYINNILGIIMKFFYIIIPNINIYSLYLIIILSICFTKIIEYVLNKKNYIYLPIILILYILTLFNITYTIIAYLSIAMGFIEIFFRKEKKHYSDYLLIINGTLLRGQALIPVLFVLGVVLLFKVLKIKDLKQVINVCSLSLFCFILVICGNLIYNTDDTLKEFKKWQDASIKLRDYKQVEYDKYEQLLAKIEWNRNDLALFYSWNFADKEKFSVDKIKTIVNNIKIEDRYNLDLKSIIINFIRQYSIAEFDLNNIYILIFIITFVMSIRNTKYKRECLYVLIATLFLHLMLIVRDRYPYRVVYPQYLLAIIYFIYASGKYDSYNKKIKYIIGINALICAVFLGLYIPKYNQISNYYKTLNKETNEFVNQINKDNKLYIMDSKTYNDLTMNYRISERKNIGEYVFFIKAGGGDCFSKRYYNYVNKYGLKYEDNLYKNLKQDNVYFIGNVNEILQKYLKENIDSKYTLNKNETINDFTIFKYMIN